MVLLIHKAQAATFLPSVYGSKAKAGELLSSPCNEGLHLPSAAAARLGLGPEPPKPSKTPPVLLQHLKL